VDDAGPQETTDVDDARAGGADIADHQLAADLANEAGRRLVELRTRLADEGADSARLRAEGDATAHRFLLSLLHDARPGDAVFSEEEDGARTSTGEAERLHAERVWIIDPLDGTREFGDPPRGDWAVHVALVVDHEPVAGAVALPAQRRTLVSWPAPPPPSQPLPTRARIVVSRSRPPDVAKAVAAALGGDLVAMGSAGAKAMAVVLGAAEAYVHAGGQYEWDSAAPVAVALAAGLHASRLDGSPLRYNQPDPYVPDLVICRPELADAVLAALAGA
jgi:3'(2'), 5'-bisphosphate nucleotidase